MDVKLMLDGLIQNAKPLATALFMFTVIALLLRTRLAKKLWASIEETLFSNWQLGLLATTGIVLGAAYMLYLYARMIYGKAAGDDTLAMPDLNKREIAMFVPIVAVIFWMGIYPESFLKPMRRDVGALVARMERANPGGDAQLAPGKSGLKVIHAGAHE